MTDEEDDDDEDEIEDLNFVAKALYLLKNDSAERVQNFVKRQFNRRVVQV